MTQLDRRLQEAARRGFTRAIIPSGGKSIGRYPGLELIEVRNLAEAVSAGFPNHIAPGTRRIPFPIQDS